ncbi:MAG TPA: transporter [Casimicrobiaceae bacterium]|nr:transporter [Casimicrobiaceae bacterium]
MLPGTLSAGHGGSIALAVVAASLGVAPTANADQSGTPFWVSGQFASLAAVPPSLGWSVNLTAYGYDGNAGGEKELPIGRVIALGANQRSPSLSIQPGYAPSQALFGGQPFLGLSFGLGGNRVQAEVTISGAATQVNRSDTLWAGTDLYPFASLGWTYGNDNWMAYLTGDIPTGAYQASRLANTGIGHGAIDGGGAYTYYDAKSGAEFSATAGLTYNWENTHTEYKNGIDSHLDWAASRFVSANWELGVAGYVYYQLTGDSGGGAKLGPFKSRAAAVGPEIGYQFTVGGQQWYANLRAYWEFWAQNRYQGYAIFATLNIPLGTGK